MRRLAMAGGQVEAGLIRDVVVFAAAHGVASGRFLAEAGLDAAQLSGAAAKVPGEVATAVWSTAERLLADPAVGLHVGAAAHPSTLGLVGDALMSAPSVGDAALRLQRYARLLSEGVVLEIVRGPRRASLRARVLDVPGNYLLHHPRHPLECTLAFLAQVLGFLAGRRLPIERVRFAHARPADASEHRRVFGVPPRFGEEVNELVVPAGSLDWPVLFSDPERLARREAELEALLAPTEATWAARARRAILELLRGEAPSVAEVAAHLSVGERTLQRGLQRERVNFRSLLDAAREELATHHLRSRPELPIAHIALLLGFSEPSAFHRSFRRWTGSTPAALRTRGAAAP